MHVYIHLCTGVQGEVQRVPIIPRVNIQKAKENMPKYDHTSVVSLRPWTYGEAAPPPHATPPEPNTARHFDAPLPYPASSASIPDATLAQSSHWGGPGSTPVRDDGHSKTQLAQPGCGDAGFSTSMEYSARSNSHSCACGTKEARLDPMAAAGREQGLHGEHFAVYCMP